MFERCLTAAPQLPQLPRVQRGPGWVPPGPLGLCSGPQRRKSGARIQSLHRRKLNTHSHFSCLINLWIFVKMGVAQVSCCVGGMLSSLLHRALEGCRPPWPAYLLSLAIFDTIPLDCASGFFVVDKVGLYGVSGWTARHGWGLGGR